MTSTSDSGTYSIAAQYRVQDGEMDAVVETLREVSALSRQEPGCLEFRVHVGAEEENRILLYEEYRSAADFEAHCTLRQFTELILGEVVPRLESRERAPYVRIV